MIAVWSDEDMRTARILAPEPSESGVNLIRGPAASEQHLAVQPENANFE
jgi:hypothetical protein